MKRYRDENGKFITRARYLELQNDERADFNDWDDFEDFESFDEEDYGEEV